MARINFEDDVESRSEFWKLLKLTNGDRDIALGRLVRFFRLAQKAYGHDQVLTEAILKEEDLLDMIQSGWVITVGEGYRAIGAATQFEWYREKVLNGKKGGVQKEKNRLAIATPIATPIAYPPAPAPAPAPALSHIKKKDISFVEKEEINNWKEKWEKEFAEIYLDYPRKEGRKAGFVFLSKRDWTDETIDQFARAVRNYSHSRNGEDAKFTKLFSTFVQCWEDWVVSPVAERDAEGHTMADIMDAAFAIQKLESEKNHA